MSLTLIVVRDKHWAIGKEGGLLCHLKEDLAFFKEKTLGHRVILGRKTLQSFPGGKPLPRREHIVLTKNTDFQLDGVEVVHSIAEALGKAEEKKAFCIGGGSIYEQMVPFCEDAYITEIDADLKGDVFLPRIDLMKDWSMESASDWQEDPRFRYRFTYWKKVGEKDV